MAIPKLRQGSYFPSFLEPRRRAEQALVAVVQEAYVNGISTRKVDRLVAQLGLQAMSKDQVSRLCRGLDEQVTVFRERPLEGAYPYLWLDAKVERVREAGGVRHKALVIAYGVHASGRREVVGIDVGEAETEAFWRSFLRSLRARGLDGVQLVISDAHPGLVAAIGSALPGASWRRCRTHCVCKESMWPCRGLGGGGDGVEVVGCVGEPGGGGGGGEAVLGQDRADLAHDVTDGASADLKQFSKGVLGAEFALVEHRCEDALGVGDLLGEHASAGTG